MHVLLIWISSLDTCCQHDFFIVLVDLKLFEVLGVDLDLS